MRRDRGVFGVMVVGPLLTTKLHVPTRRPGALVPHLDRNDHAALLYRSRLVPRILPVLGLIGAPLLLASNLAVLFGLWQQFSVPAGLATVPILVWELGLGPGGGRPGRSQALVGEVEDGPGASQRAGR